MNPEEPTMQEIQIPERYNYIAAFLTLACNLRCSFCINQFGGTAQSSRMMSGADWLKGLNRFQSRPDLPITLQGGEPSLHPDFYDILRGLREDLNVDILTNLQLDVHEFMKQIPPERIKRSAPYASIRVSFHPETMQMEELKPKVLLLQEHGYSVGIWAVAHPGWQKEIERARAQCLVAGIDFRVKEFLGFYQGKIYGHYKYPDAITDKQGPPMECRTSELIIGPGGDIFRCHSDLYAGRSPIGHLLNEEFQIRDLYRPCDFYGYCNPCDVKIKTNRFQETGHTSVDIRERRAPLSERKI